MEGQFYGAVIKPNKVVPFVPPPESERLHISSVCLPPTVPVGARVALKVKYEDESMYLATMTAGTADTIQLDLIFDRYCEFSAEGGHPLHLSGYYLSMAEEAGDDEDDDEERYMAQMLGVSPEQVAQAQREAAEAEEDSSEDDEDFEMGSGDEEEDVPYNQYPPGTAMEELAELSGEEDVPPRGRAAAGASSDSSEGCSSGEESSEEEEPQPQRAPPSGKKEKKEAAKRKAEPAPEPVRKVAKAEPASAQKADKKQKGKAAEATPAKKEQAAAKTPTKAEAKAAAEEAPAKAEAKVGKGTVKRFDNGFVMENTAMGKPNGKLAANGKKVVMKYTGKLANGKVFDATKGKATFAFRLGVGEVIKGWDRGVVGMRVGDKRRLTIPPQMAYGSSGVRGAIPPNATLTFDVEVVDVK